MFEAKVVATTMPLQAATILRISGPTRTSDRPGFGLNTLVESQASASTPGAETSAQRSGS